MMLLLVIVVVDVGVCGCVLHVNQLFYRLYRKPTNDSKQNVIYAIMHLHIFTG